MKSIATKTVSENGIEYIIETLSSGHTVKRLKQQVVSGDYEQVYKPTETELVQAEILLNQAEILAKQNEQDEVLAEILLNQMGV